MSDSKLREDVFAGVELVPSGARAVLLTCPTTNPRILRKSAFQGSPAGGFLSGFLSDAVAEHGSIAAAGIAFPRELESDAASAGADLFKVTGTKPLTESSARAGAIGESVLGAGCGKQNFFYATLGTPVGGALMLNGALWRGVSGQAGGFGDMVVDADGRTVNDFATDESILRRTRNRFQQDSTSSLVSIGESTLSVGDIIAEALKGDELAMMMLERTGRFSGVAVGSVISLLNIDTVIVGGSIVRDGTGVLEGLVQGARDHCSGPSFEAVEILPAELGEFSAAFGAAMLAGGRRCLTGESPA